MTFLAVSFILLFDLVLVAGFWVFHNHIPDRFYKRCMVAFLFESVATISVFGAEMAEWRPLLYTLMFDCFAVKGLMLWSAVKSLDHPRSHKWWVPGLFVGYFMLVVFLGVVKMPDLVVANVALMIPLAFNLAPAWAIYRSRWIQWRSYQFFCGCILVSQILYNLGTQFAGLSDDASQGFYFLGMVSNIFVGLSALMIGMKRLHGRLEVAHDTIQSICNQTDAIVTASRDSILITDLKGTIRFANPVASGFFVDGTETSSKLFDQSFASHQSDEPPFTLEWVHTELNSNPKGFVRRECIMKHRSLGDLPVEWTVVRIQDEKDALLVFYMRDLREQRRHEEEIIHQRDLAEQLNQKLSTALEDARTLQDKAEQANASKDDFLGVMSHELRTPLSAIIGLCNMLRQESLTLHQRQNVAAIADCGQSLLLIIGDILNYSRIEAGRIELDCTSFQMRHCMEQVVILVKDQCNQKGIRLLPTIDPELPSDWIGDEGKVRQILTNLVTNAVKFTDRGNVRIDVRLGGKGPEGLQHVEITVRDTGIGISDDQQERLFEAFYQADYSASRRYSGTGLGLSICKRLVDAMHGEIQVESSPGNGACFKVILPLKRDESVSTGHVDPFNGFKGVLHYVDPDAPTRQWMADVMQVQGIGIRCHASITDFMEHQASGEKGGSEVWLVDQDALKDSKAIEWLLHHVRSDTPQRQIVCAYHQLSEVMVSFEHLVSKPFLIDQIFDRLQDAPLPEPVTKPEEAATPFPAPVEGPLGLNVLVVEDHPINAKLVRIHLAKLGCHSEFVQNGVEALELIENRDFDAVLMDLHMPQMDGFTTTKEMLERLVDRPQPRIIALTAGVTAQERDRALQEGMSDFITKPIRFERLVEALQKVEKTTPTTP